MRESSQWSAFHIRQMWQINSLNLKRLPFRALLTKSKKQTLLTRHLHHFIYCTFTLLESGYVGRYDFIMVAKTFQHKERHVCPVHVEQRCCSTCGFQSNDAHYMNAALSGCKQTMAQGMSGGEITYWFFCAVVPHWFNIHRHIEASNELYQSLDTFLPRLPRRCGSSMFFRSSGFSLWA